MAGTIVAGTLSDGTYSGSVTDTVRGACKAWVNFNGTGTVAIRASYNVSSITDRGTGKYTVNFTTAMSDTNYSALISTASPLSVGNDISGEAIFTDGSQTPEAPTTSSFKIFIYRDGITDLDSPYINIAVFR